MEYEESTLIKTTLKVSGIKEVLTGSLSIQTLIPNYIKMYCHKLNSSSELSVKCLIMVDEVS